MRQKQERQQITAASFTKMESECDNGQMILQKPISRVALKKMLNSYRTEYNCPYAEVEFDTNSKVYLRLQTTSYPDLTYNQARNVLQFLLRERVGGKGYTEKDGVAMSVNAKGAIERGLERASQISQDDLRKAGFTYPPEFFRWLVRLYNIEPDERHHVTEDMKYVGFYSQGQIHHMAEHFDLQRLYNIYSGRSSREKELKKLDIRYARARLPVSMIGGDTDNEIEETFLYFRGVLFYATWIAVPETEKGLGILEIYEKRPESLSEERQEEFTKIEDGLLKSKKQYYRNLAGEYITLPERNKKNRGREEKPVKHIALNLSNASGTYHIKKQSGDKNASKKLLMELLFGDYENELLPNQSPRDGKAEDASENAQNGHCTALQIKGEQCTINAAKQEKKANIEFNNNKYQNTINQVKDAEKSECSQKEDKTISLPETSKPTRNVVIEINGKAKPASKDKASDNSPKKETSSKPIKRVKYSKPHSRKKKKGAYSLKKQNAKGRSQNKAHSKQRAIERQAEKKPLRKIEQKCPIRQKPEPVHTAKTIVPKKKPVAAPKRSTGRYKSEGLASRKKQIEKITESRAATTSERGQQIGKKTRRVLQNAWRY